MSDQVPAALLTILVCGYSAPCRQPNCRSRATMILRKSEANGRPIRQREFCNPHAEQIVATETARGLRVIDWRVRDA